MAKFNINAASSSEIQMKSDQMKGLWLSYIYIAKKARDLQFLVSFSLTPKYKNKKKNIKSLRKFNCINNLIEI